MDALQQPGSPAILDKLMAQLGMKIQHLAQRKSGLFATIYKLAICGCVLMECSGLGSRDHFAAELFQPIAELDIFHSINAKFFIKPTRIAKCLTRSRNIAGVVIGKIHRSGFDAVRI